jgi:RecA-family ATPase
MIEIIQLGRKTSDTRPPYLIEGILPRGGCAVVHGDRGARTALTFDLMMHIALGSPYRGRAVSQGAVVYVGIDGIASIGTA